MKQTKNERVKEIRTLLNLTQAQMCQRLSITLATLSRIENNGYELSAKIERAILDNMGVSKEWFETGKGQPFPEGKPEIDKSSYSSSNPYRDALINELKEKNTFLERQTEWLQNLVNTLTQKGANANFNMASDVAEFRLNLLGGNYSGAMVA